MSQNLSSEENIYPTNVQVVGVDSSVRPAPVTILSSHDSKKDASEAKNSCAEAKIDIYDISHSVLEI